MYQVKIQSFDNQIKGRDIALPVSVHTVGTVPTRRAAEQYARMFACFDYVAAAWVEVIATVH